MQIKINSKFNEKMLENYPDDPYSDLCIITQTRRLNLVLAYLSIDSTYFANIDPDTRQINLSHLNQEPLIRIIRSLYGEILTANTISQLTQLYQIIRELQIDDYRTNIQKQILQKPFTIESIEFLQFSFSNNLLVQKVIQFHIQNKLKLLESNRNYLQLNKISVETFQILVQKFIQFQIKQNNGSIQQLLTKPQSQIINHVMQNYFNRNNIKAINYFKQNTFGTCQQMQIIWNKYHHKIYFTPTSTTSLGTNLQIGNLGNMTANLSAINNSQINNQLRGGISQYLTVKNPFQGSNPKLRKKSEQTINVNINSNNHSPEIQRKKQKVHELEQQIKQRDDTIAQLQKQINQLKQLKSLQQQQKITRRTSAPITNQIPQVLDQQELMKKSVEQESLSFLPNIKKGVRKSKQYEGQEDFTVSSVFQPAFNGVRKIPQMKQIRTMKKTTGVAKNKFLPN